MTNNQFVIDNYELIKTCCMFQMRKYGTPADLFDDLVEEISEIILNYPNDKLNDVVDNHHENAFVTGILLRTLYSKNSGFYRTFRKFNSLCNEISGLEYKY